MGEIGWKPTYAISPMRKKQQNPVPNNNEAPSIMKYGLTLNGQIVALCMHCAKGTPFTCRPYGP